MPPAVTYARYAESFQKHANIAPLPNVPRPLPSFTLTESVPLNRSYTFAHRARILVGYGFRDCAVDMLQDVRNIASLAQNSMKSVTVDIVLSLNEMARLHGSEKPDLRHFLDSCLVVLRNEQMRPAFELSKDHQGTSRRSPYH